MAADPLDKLSERTEELRAAAAEQREVLRELHAAIKDGRKLLKELHDTFEACLDADVKAIVDERIEAILVPQIEAMSELVKVTQDAAVDKVIAEFDNLSNIILGKDQGEGSIPALVKRKAGLQ